MAQGIDLHPGMNVWLPESGRYGRVQSIRIVSTGETIDSYQLSNEMEPLVVTLVGKGYSTKQFIQRPDAIRIDGGQHGRIIDDDLLLSEEKEPMDNEVIFGDGGDDDENPLQDIIDNMEPEPGDLS